MGKCGKKGYRVGMDKRTQIGYLDGERFIATMERASEAGNADFVAANMAKPPSWARSQGGEK